MYQNTRVSLLLLAVLQVLLHRQPGSSYPPEQTYTRKSWGRTLWAVRVAHVLQQRPLSLIRCFLGVIDIHGFPANQAVNRWNNSIHPHPSDSQFLAHRHPIILVSYGESLQRHCTSSGSYMFLFPRLYTSACILHTLLCILLFST